MTEDFDPTEEQIETAMAITEFINMARERTEAAMAETELLTHGLIYLMRLHNVDHLEINEADAGAVMLDLEDKGLHLHMEVDVPEDEAEMWSLHFRLEESDDTHPSEG